MFNFLHRRKAPERTYYVTLVAYRRGFLFGEIADGQIQPNALGKIVQTCWDALPQQFSQVKTESLVVLPNHLHGLLTITPTESQRERLLKVLQAYQTAVTYTVQETLKLNDLTVWQGKPQTRTARNAAEVQRWRESLQAEVSQWEHDPLFIALG